MCGPETVRAFVPPPLPPVPSVDLTGFQVVLEQANQSLGRLDGLAAILPGLDVFLYACPTNEQSGGKILNRGLMPRYA